LSRTRPPTCWINLFAVSDFLGGSFDDLLEALVVDISGRPLGDLISGEAGERDGQRMDKSELSVDGREESLLFMAWGMGKQGQLIDQDLLILTCDQTSLRFQREWRRVKKTIGKRLSQASDPECREMLSLLNFFMETESREHPRNAHSTKERRVRANRAE